MNASHSRGQVAGLLTRTQQDDLAAREQLLALYRPYLRRLARQRLPRLIHKRSDGSDIVQQTLIDAHRGLPEFRGRSEPQFTAWMHRLLERNLLQAIRRNTSAKRDVRLELDGALQADSAQLAWHSLAADGSSPASSVFRGEAALQICQALELLPDDQRQAIELRYLDQQPLQTIADAMERTVNSVAGLIYRGMKTLQSLLPTEFGELS